MRWRILVGGLLAILPLLWVFAASFGKDPRRIDSPLISRPAPLFELQPLNGSEPVTLASLRGKPTVVNFWATWCEPCKAEHGVLQSAAKHLGEHVNFVGIAYDDDPQRIQAFLEEHGGLGYPTLVDKGGKAAIAYGVSGVPETFFLSRSGMVVSKHTGALDPKTLAAQVMRAMEAP